MSRKSITFGLGGIFIMLSLFVLMIGVQFFLDSLPYLTQLLVGLVSGGIGFYLLGYSLDS